MNLGELYARLLAKNPQFVQSSIGSQTSHSSHAETWALLSLAIHGERRMSELTEFLGIPASTASFTVDKLAKRNLVLRIRPEDDRRSVVVSLTPEGLEMVQTIYSQTEQLMKRMLLLLQSETKHLLSDEESTVLAKLVSRLISNPIP